MIIYASDNFNGNTDIDRFIGKSYWVKCNFDNNYRHIPYTVYTKFVEDLGDAVSVDCIASFYIDNYSYTGEGMYPEDEVEYMIVPKDNFQIEEPLDILSEEEFQELLAIACDKYTQGYAAEEDYE